LGVIIKKESVLFLTRFRSRPLEYPLTPLRCVRGSEAPQKDPCVTFEPTVHFARRNEALLLSLRIVI